MHLKVYGFGPKFLTVLQTLYSAPIARLLVKGYNSHQIDIHRGTRQGCPLSSILFILALEPLAIKLRCHPDIKGIHCGDFEHKRALFADNILLLLSSLVTSLPNLYQLMRHFSTISGLSINLMKSVALISPWIGGSLGVPNFAKYFHSAQLAQPIHFHSLTPQPT